jgi:thioredoxin reductase
MHRDLQLASELLRTKINRSLVEKMEKASVYTFKNGIGNLSTTLVDRLTANPNVKFKLNTEVSSVEHDTESDQVTVRRPHPKLKIFIYNRIR